ncbi:MAG: glycoside hydrolase family protein [Planctomycetota bacterium]|jgi:hypothetical protein
MWQPANPLTSIRAGRHPDGPLLTAESSPSIGTNINGPSVIRVPDWIENPFGRYYMYFAHHKGGFIRLAFADDPRGPWSVHEPGTLRVEDVGAIREHIASPDVHVDEAERRIRMYFHGPATDRPGQWTYLATSGNGIEFVASPENLGCFYFRVWSWEGSWYAVAKDRDTGWGHLYRSPDGMSGFESRGRFLRRMRHAAVLVRAPYLLIFYSRTGDAPEHILCSTIDLRLPWEEWVPSKPRTALKPELDYEGIGYRNRRSRNGPATMVRQLRDPCIFEEDGRVYLYYSIAGEMGIAMADLELVLAEPAATPGHRIPRLLDRMSRSLLGRPL